MKCLKAALGGVLFLSSAVWADTVVGSADAEWQTWQSSSPSNNGGEFWDNRSWDGRSCNIGYWLTGAATGCSNSLASSGLPLGQAPGELAFWGRTRGTNDSSYYFSSSNADRVATLRIEVAGNRNYNSFGWYSLSAPSTLNQLFAGANGPVLDSAAFTPTGNFGYYFTDRDGNTYRTSGSSHQRFALFRETPGGTSGTEADTYWLGLEDLPLSASDRDYNDLVVRISEVPEPAAYLVLGLGLGIIYLNTRRRRINAA